MRRNQVESVEVLLDLGARREARYNPPNLKKMPWLRGTIRTRLFERDGAMDDRTFSALELNALKELLARNVQTPMGRRRVEALLPSADAAAIARALDLTSECSDSQSAGERFGFSGIDDPEPALARLQVEETSLDPQQILLLERLISIGEDLHRLFRDPDRRARYPRLAAEASRIPDMRPLLADIRGKVLPGGEIDDGASAELRSIRREITDSRVRVQRALESILRKENRAVQEEIVTFRNGRFVIPIRTDSRGAVPGVVHGLSSSGQTTFVEPLSIIEQNNDLVRLKEQEEIEIARILYAITERLRESLPAVRAAACAIESLDFSQAKGLLSIQFRCTRPQISETRWLRLLDARHILLQHALQGSGSDVVPISLEMDEDHGILVISGANAGGKTIVLKTVGLIALMTQMGLHVPAREVTIPIFDQVFADIGDQQSISANLSTFTAHMRNVAGMAHDVAPRSLILLDEVGTGTDPDEGAALAEAIVDFFRRACATAIATTHYNPLKMWATRTPGVLNASVEFDDKTLRPTYRLIMGIAGASSGIEIARRMELPASILEGARALIDPSQSRAGEYLRRLKDLVQEQETLRAALSEEREAVAREYAGLDLAFARREGERKAEFERALSLALEQFAEESGRLLHGLRDRAQAARLKKAAEKSGADLRRKVAHLAQQVGPQGSTTAAGTGSTASRELHASSTVAGTEIQAGARVRIVALDKEGSVESISGSSITVAIGPLKYRATREELQLLPGSTKAGEKPAPHPPAASGPDLADQFVPEINLIGMTADDATDRVDKFLDEAFLAGTESVRIIHGHGKGILRKAIATLLTGHPQVEGFRPAPPNQGGTGATLVDIKK